MTQRKPWAFIGHKDGYWFGLASASMPKKDLGKYLSDWAMFGGAITTVYDRDEYNSVLNSLKPWPNERRRTSEQAELPL